mmetsp:Transcript_40262/g.88029  ORF Transcript_40262/g.88029 Transcript_40262/m.88029 type:complete len:205 (-) Transcript_40262:1001-1615(-)
MLYMFCFETTRKRWPRKPDTSLPALHQRDDKNCIQHAEASETSSEPRRRCHFRPECGRSRSRSRSRSPSGRLRRAGQRVRHRPRPRGGCSFRRLRLRRLGGLLRLGLIDAHRFDQQASLVGVAHRLRHVAAPGEALHQARLAVALPRDLEEGRVSCERSRAGQAGVPHEEGVHAVRDVAALRNGRHHEGCAPAAVARHKEALPW